MMKKDDLSYIIIVIILTIILMTIGLIFGHWKAELLLGRELGFWEGLWYGIILA